MRVPLPAASITAKRSAITASVWSRRPNTGKLSLSKEMALHDRVAELHFPGAATIAFDLDGTLVDTAPDLRRALNHVLALEGAPPANLEQVRRLVGRGARTLIMRALDAHGVSPSPQRLDELTMRYVEVYASDIAQDSRPFPGVEDALDRLVGAGVRLCVCTNKQTHLSVQLLDALGLASRFAAIVGADLAPAPKPSAMHFEAAVRAAGGEPSLAMMVGDSAADVGAARAAGRPVALVSFGYTDTPPELLGADVVFGHFSQLPAIAARLLTP